ncbi:5-methyltetrahydropteroyltriglutamate--homocysteine S-methyltransferase [Bacillus sp. SJS]|uniref:5-methyltetrahydropteroyltriglutamate-- homocysteine S-methyltransferase n=1 Tax=Bacillus sp. SJS TaxID=1423321 RepID=UPI000B1128B4|nr:5-methyltetrahydropteroyltriglutamate--homocysteine S-methyltransferase [Bacillus sp. SJS]
MKLKSSNQGYPRLGQNREWKKVLESFWKKEISEPVFLSKMKELRIENVRKQKEAGIDLVPVGDFTFYDAMLDMAWMFNLIPERHRTENPSSIDCYFSMARGSKRATACAMTKWFDTNYHYLVPEWEGSEPKLNFNKPLEHYLEAKEWTDGKPVIIGPYTFIRLSKGYESLEKAAEKLLPLYAQLLQQLEEHGAQIVQVDEPAFVYEETSEDFPIIQTMYSDLDGKVSSLKICIQTYFESPEAYQQLMTLPVSGWGLDFTRGNTIDIMEKHRFPSDKILAAGMIDGRNIWRAKGTESLKLMEFLQNKIKPCELWIQPSCSLIHVPETLEGEVSLPAGLYNNLSFAKEKLEECVLLAGSSDLEAKNKILEWDHAYQDLTNYRKSENLSDQVQSFKRKQPFSEREEIQRKAFQLPLLPLTTIGSFPQTKEVRKQRKRFRDGLLSKQEYDVFVKRETKRWIGIQEEAGLDVLVHGEFERNDMVEYFGENLDGFAFTKHGWVQSYGSRGVKPPIIFGDIGWRGPITSGLALYSQSLSDKPVKGMLTGPVTILNWSFPRDDQSSEVLASFIAAALRKEVLELEKAGISMIQIDEPAFREGLPLKKSKQAAYTEWAVNAFRATHWDVRADTQIHTHMCYSDFSEMIDAISDMDADVLSIETSRGGGEMISTFKEFSYDKMIGLGVYDIHSPRIPSAAEMEKVIEQCLVVLPAGRFWINPDCGLKTRSEEEAIQSLRNMAEAAFRVRENLSISIV